MAEAIESPATRLMMKRTRTTLYALALASLFATVSPAADASAQCVPPNLNVASGAVCMLGENCDISINLDTAGGDFAAATATMSSNGAIACKTPCSPGAAAAGLCNINPVNCAWNVTDFSFTPFGDGEVAVVTIQCGQVGTFDLDLSGVSLGDTGGLPQASCGNSASFDCVECTDSLDCGAGEVCDGDGVCVECLGDGDCADGNACTVDTCIAGSCSNDSAAADGQGCDDGLFCTATDTCSAGSCVGAGDPCPGTECADTCNESADSCFETAGTSCDDGDLCTDNDQCNGAGTCVSGGATDCSGLDSDCAVGTCDPGNGACFADPLAAGTACSDGAFCNGAETCDGAGSCQAGSAPNCDDGVGCTIDSCNEGSDSCNNIVNDASCSDGLFCNGVETCDATNDCQAGSAPNCDDGVGCTIDSCNEGSDTCDNVVDNGSCDDGLFCNGVESCSAVNNCQAGTPVVCNDGVGCTNDSCNEGSDSCDFVVDNGNCDNGLFCDGVETCSAVSDCQAGTPVACDDGVGCTNDSCNEGSDSCQFVVDNGNCDDGSFCNGAEVCNAVSDCQAGSAPNCDDGVGCTIDSCNEGSDSCDNALDHGSCDNGLFCDGNEVCHPTSDCQAGAAPNCDDGVSCTNDSCLEGSDSCSNVADNGNCDNGLFCDGNEVCHPTNDCQAGTAPNCDDGVGCTNDICREGIDSCDNVVDNGNCDNGLFCDGTEICHPTNDCQAGTAPNCDDGVSCTNDICREGIDRCENAVDDSNCDNGLFCDGAETCDAVNDCEAGAAPTIDDGVSCTADSCDEANDQVVNAPSDAVCDDGAFCNGAETCDAVNDCQAGTAPTVDDGVTCTIDLCDEVNDTVRNDANDGLCDDGAFCNGTETCDATNGCQAGVGPVVDDGVSCTIDSCNEVTDTVANVATDGLCDDGAFCNGSETCDAAADCQAGTAPVVSDGIDCTNDSCDETNDVVVNAVDDGNCDDGLFCNGAETCSATADCQVGRAPDCDDGVGCTDDACNEGQDSCTNTPNAGNCDDGAFCNGTEICDATNDCQAGTAPVIDDGVGCTNDSCDEANDVVINVTDNASCDDGQFCNGVETCHAAFDCQAGQFPCSDGVGCTLDGCHEPTDTCVNSPSDMQCDDGQACNGAESCDVLLGCMSELPVDCEELDDECSFGTCSDDEGGCVSQPLLDGTSCEDGNACTLDDECMEGTCIRTTFCGVPVSRGEKPLVSDALYVLRASVGLEICTICECDVNTDGKTTVSDALGVLQTTVDLPVTLGCFEPLDESLMVDESSAQ